MAKIRIHGHFYRDPIKYMVIATNSVDWIDWIPGVLSVGKWSLFQIKHDRLESGKYVRECVEPGFDYVGAVPADQLDIEYHDKFECHGEEYYSFTLKGWALHKSPARMGMWTVPENFITNFFNNHRYSARVVDMPIFHTLPEARKPVQEMSFYELRLAESRAKCREEDARAPARRAFEFL